MPSLVNIGALSYNPYQGNDFARVVMQGFAMGQQQSQFVDQMQQRKVEHADELIQQNVNNTFKKIQVNMMQKEFDHRVESDAFNRTLDEERLKLTREGQLQEQTRFEKNTELAERRLDHDDDYFAWQQEQSKIDNNFRAASTSSNIIVDAARAAEEQRRQEDEPLRDQERRERIAISQANLKSLQDADAFRNSDEGMESARLKRGAEDAKNKRIIETGGIDAGSGTAEAFWGKVSVQNRGFMSELADIDSQIEKFDFTQKGLTKAETEQRLTDLKKRRERVAGQVDITSNWLDDHPIGEASPSSGRDANGLPNEIDFRFMTPKNVTESNAIAASARKEAEAKGLSKDDTIDYVNAAVNKYLDSKGLGKKEKTTSSHAPADVDSTATQVLSPAAKALQQGKKAGGLLGDYDKTK